jgi:hypothetical protein
MTASQFRWNSASRPPTGSPGRCQPPGFRHLRGEARAEAIQNALCNACAAIARLAELGKLDLCYASVLARFAIAQTKDGRMLGRPLNCKDVASKYCQRAKNVVMERLDKYDAEEGCWLEAVRLM